MLMSFFFEVFYFHIQCFTTNVIGQINIMRNKMLFLYIFCWESFVGNDCLKPGTHGHHQRLGFLLLWCFARPLMQLTLADMLNQVEIKRLIWPLQNIPHFYHQKLLGCFCCMIWVIVHLYYEVLSNQLCSIWLNLGRQYIPVHFRIQSTASVICHIINKHQ